MNHSRKGARAERRSIRLLEALGYVCTRSAASKGPWDVVAVGPTDVQLVQVKAGDAWPSAVELEALGGLRVPASVRVVVHRWRRRASAPDVREVRP